jgi:hypothetical protein
MDERIGTRPGPARPGHRGTRWAAGLSLAAVTLIAAIASYLHALKVVQAADGHTAVAWFIPVMADLVIASGAANLLDASRGGGKLPRLSMAAIGVGVVVTVAANVASGSPHAVPSWCVNIWPPVAFTLALESLVGQVRRGGSTGTGKEIAVTESHCPHGEAATADDVVRLVHDHAKGCTGEPLSARRLADITAPSRTRVAEVVRQSVNGDGPAPPDGEGR